MNSTQEIRIFDMPRCLRSGFTALPRVGRDPSLDNGNIISEVGEPIYIRTPACMDDFQAYPLRKHRKVKLPDHVFGKADFGNAFSAFLPRVVSLPAIGTSIVLQPRVTPEQATLINLYRNAHADFIWIVHIPSPLGVGVLVEVYAPEIDLTTKTRSVRFRPAGVNTIAFHVPWSSDLSVVPRTAGRIGQSGGAITIRVVEDNTTDQVNTPLAVTVYQACVNVRCNTKVPSTIEFETIPGFEFIPQPEPVEPPPPEEDGVFEFHGGDEPTVEVQAEGVGDVAEQIQLDATPATELAPEAEKPSGKAEVPSESRSTRNNIGLPSTRWFEAGIFTIGTDNLLTWQNLFVNPYNLIGRGENISKPYRRNVWVSGSNKAGYVRTMRVKIVIARPPSVSGVVEFQDSRNDSSRYIVEIGGNKEFDLIPRYFAGAIAQARPRYYNNRFLRTDEAQVDWRYRVTGFNRTSETADVSVRILYKVGSTYFDVPTKPRPETSTLGWLVEQFNDFVEQKDLQVLNKEPIVGFVFHGDDEGDNTFDTSDKMAPYAGEGSYTGEINAGEAFNEDIDQDDFAVEIWNGVLPVGSIVTIPLNMSVIPDEAGTGGISTIAQKFERNAHIVPTGEGNLGPSLGYYTIETRLPTTISGQISHVSLPGDMSDEAAAFAFGLGNILSIATSALQALGGPTVSAGITAGRAIFDVIKNIGGKLINKSDSDSANQPSASGPIDVSRFVNFLKPIFQNEEQDPTFGSLLVQARDFLGFDGAALENIPARIWARMDKSMVERSLFDRLLVPSNTMANEIVIPYDRWGHIVDLFGSHPDTFKAGTHQNACWLKFISVIRHQALRSDVTSLKLKDILDYEVTPDDELAISKIITDKQLSLLP
ncbi:putative ORF4 [Caledonia beadlet anemone Nora virus-like virus 1]|nr:putative ORF4 [Caledonia beadlet anemone Nora virus-like virus 1]